jgi:predicted HD superfamily hydrolase involved in NAD metabolism
MPGTLRRQIERVQAEMQSRPQRLIEHVERVAREALAIGEYWDVDPDRLELASWGHDLFRHEPEERQLQLAAESGVAVSSEDRRSPIVLHGPIAATVLEHRFGIDDRDVLAGVRDHTLGIPEMSLIGKIILLADKVEPNKRKRTPEMKRIRRLAWRDLDIALLCWADWKWVDEREHGYESHPAHWRARTTWVREHHLDADPPDSRLESVQGASVC